MIKIVISSLIFFNLAFSSEIKLENAEIREFLKDMINENLNEIGACNTELWKKDNN